MHIAVIGSGISGLTAAWLLSGGQEVTLLEAGDHLGGHTNTIEVEVAGRTHVVDTGFMVFNRRTYPNFCRLLEVLGIESQASDMSFSVRDLRTGLEYEGSSLNGLFAQRSNLLRPAFYRLLAEILRFQREAAHWLKQAADEPLTLGDFLRRGRFRREMLEHYLLPMSAAIWSAQPQRMLDFPARFLLTFFENHGLLAIFNRPVWRTIPGGARRYVARMAAAIGRVRTSCPVLSVAREPDRVQVRLRSGEAEYFDHVVLATHADQALRMLSDADEREREILAAFPYQRNAMVVHTDTSVLPRSRRAWASWNCLVAEGEQSESEGKFAVTYDLTRLQRIATRVPILATLSGGVLATPIDPRQVLRRIEYQHPVFGPQSVAAQARWSEISGRRRTHFCGAYWGNGFHEDGVNSALAVARSFGQSMMEPRATGVLASA